MREIGPIGADVFWKRVARRGRMECWPWGGSLNRDGYGTLHVAGVRILAHRVAYKIHNGNIPAKKPHVLHSCDNPPCCNPAHLFAGTIADNNSDMEKKGRARKARGNASGSRLHPERLPRGDRHLYRRHPELCVRGTKNGQSKLSDKEVAEIRRLYASGGWTHRSLGVKYGIRHSGIYSVIHGKQWRHVA